jgi:hypothetical protein
LGSVAGQSVEYEYGELQSLDTARSCKGAARLRERYVLIAKAWDTRAHSEWTCRFFMSAKLIMNATLLLNANEYARDSNLRVVQPYLRYYAYLSLMRAVCYTLPDFAWNGGELIEISHAAAIRGAITHLQRFDSAQAKHAEALIERAKADRELISYRAPSSADDNLDLPGNIDWLCTLLAELAQFDSELLAAAVEKYADSATFDLHSDDAEAIAFANVGGVEYIDDEDAHRLASIWRKGQPLAHLRALLRAGQIDDYFGAWNSDDRTAEAFNPDLNIRRIFDLP